MDHKLTSSSSPRPLSLGIAFIVAAYFVTISLWGTDWLHVGHKESEQVSAALAATSELPAGGHPDSGQQAPGEPHTASPHNATSTVVPSLAAVIPFVLLLGAIAVFPLFSLTEHWWESNRNRLLVATILAAVTLLYYFAIFPGGGGEKVTSVLEHAVLGEYIPFIVLLFTLYTISGGIRIQGDLVARPSTNVKFLAVGGLLASFVGTTGAAMLLIRPLIETNQERKHVQHTVVFFIFVVCNCGGCLLPIGDPPLFLGYLEGVDFFWTMRYLWFPWLVTNTLIIGIYYIWDQFVCYKRETKLDLKIDVAAVRPLKIEGLRPNLPLLVGVILSVAFLDPNKTLPGTAWHPWPFLREIIQVALVGLSLQLGSTATRAANRFNYHAILEVAALFVGIFICMQPAIEILRERGGSLQLDTPRELYWATGILSAVLDNAPTYLVFFQTAAAEPAFAGLDFPKIVSQSGGVAEHARDLLISISLGSVFMGSMTYIGNGPNFMVKAIAEQAGVEMPSFFGYLIRYSLLVLGPVFLFVSYFLLS